MTVGRAQGAGLVVPFAMSRPAQLCQHEVRMGPEQDYERVAQDGCSLHDFDLDHSAISELSIIAVVRAQPLQPADSSESLASDIALQADVASDA